MALQKPTSRKISISDIVANRAINVREHDEYDLESMAEQIAQIGRVTDPLVVELVVVDGNEIFNLLQGFRRLGGALVWYNNPSCPADLKEAISKLECLVYKDLTDLEREELIMDDGGKKTLGYVEIAKAVKRLLMQGLDFQQITVRLYNSLLRTSSKMTGDNAKKFKEAMDKGDRKAMHEASRAWLHGRLQQGLIDGANCGNVVWEQILIQEYAKDGKKAPAEMVFKFYPTTTRIRELKKALKDDATKAKFNELLLKYQADDAADVKPEKVTSLTRKTLLSKVELYESRAFKKVLEMAAGNEVPGLAAVDAEAFRLDMITDTLLARNVKPEFAAFAKAIVKGKAGDLEQFLIPAVKPEVKVEAPVAVPEVKVEAPVAPEVKVVAKESKNSKKELVGAKS